MIIFEGVYKKYKDNILFKDVNIKFPKNKKILIKGINGSGKSVLLKMIVGYSKPDIGTITVDNKIIGKDVDFLADAGITINAPDFMADLTGLENLKYLANINKKVSEDKIIELVKLFDLEYNINKKYKTYSLGMKQKLRLIQAFMEEPSYLILDEPFDALDKKTQDLLMNMLDKFIKQKNKTLIYTSHNSEYEKFADIIYELNDYNVEKTK